MYGLTTEGNKLCNNYDELFNKYIELKKKYDLHWFYAIIIVVSIIFGLLLLYVFPHVFSFYSEPSDAVQHPVY